MDNLEHGLIGPNAQSHVGLENKHGVDTATTQLRPMVDKIALEISQKLFIVTLTSAQFGRQKCSSALKQKSKMFLYK